jgi:hypothetical protein
MRSLTIWIMLGRAARRGFADGFNDSAARTGGAENEIHLCHKHSPFRHSHLPARYGVAKIGPDWRLKRSIPAYIPAYNVCSCPRLECEATDSGRGIQSRTRERSAPVANEAATVDQRGRPYSALAPLPRDSFPGTRTDFANSASETSSSRRGTRGFGFSTSSK